MANEKRLIDANVLEKLVHKHRATYLFNEDVLAAIAKQPTVDAVEVVHGCWNITDHDSGDPGHHGAYLEVICSDCGLSVGVEQGEYDWHYGEPFPWEYCPACGTKMDSGKKMEAT